MQTLEEILTRGVFEVIGQDDLVKRAQSGEKLRIKLGIDPTSPNIHLGRSVPLLKLRAFQQLGHTVVFIIGDFTGLVGDTSDKDSERPMLTAEAVQENLRTYMEQAGKIIDLSQAEVVYNSQWLSKLTLSEIGTLADAFSVSEFCARENIAKRLDAGKRVSLREMLYPLMQGYDSVQIKSDVELGGSDQRFNCLAGRTLQAAAKLRPQAVLLTNLIPGTDGRKMSSSWGNTINLTDSAREMFGKVMSIPDELILPYFEQCTIVSLDTVATYAEYLKNGTNPRDVKIELAKALVGFYHSTEAATSEEEFFISAFSKGIVGEVEPVYFNNDEPLIDTIVRLGIFESRGEIKRLFEQGGVSIGEMRVADISYPMTDAVEGQVLKIGKKHFYRLHQKN